MNEGEAGPMFVFEMLVGESGGDRRDIALHDVLVMFTTKMDMDKYESL